MRNEIEEKARPLLIPLIKGERFRLLPAQQHQIAAWVALKCMISEYDVGSYATTHHAHRKRMMKIHKPPEKGWGIWIASCDRNTPGPTWYSMGFYIATNPKPGLDFNQPPPRYNSHASTQIINKLFIQVVRLPLRNFITDWHFDLPDGGSLYRIWPPAQFSINWPGQALSDRESRSVTTGMEDFILNIARKRGAKG